jgi:hypothetical protein
MWVDRCVRAAASNEELKLSACKAGGRTPVVEVEALAGSAWTGRSLTPVRYPAQNEIWMGPTLDSDWMTET